MRSETQNQHLTLIAFLALVTSTAVCTEQRDAPAERERVPAAEAARTGPWNCAKASELDGCELRTTAATGEASDSVLGVVGDLVVDLQLGAVIGARIDSGGLAGIGAKQRFVPLNELDLRVLPAAEGEDADKHQIALTTSLTRAQFEAKPEFDQAQLAALPRTVEAGSGERGQAGRAGGAQPSTVLSPVLLSDLKSIDVRSGDAEPETFGQISDLAIDPDHGQVHFAIVSAGGLAGFGSAQHPVPHRAIRADLDPTDDSAEPRLRLSLAQTHAQLESAPKIDREAGLTLEDPTFREQVERFYAAPTQKN